MSTRTPGPCGVWNDAINPGDGRKSCSGSSAFRRISIAWPRRGRGRLNQLLAGGDAQLLAHQVDPGAHLGDRMLDLETGVQLDEVEAAVRPEQELERAGVPIRDRTHARSAADSIASRASGVSAALGDSSISFWWRRWIEQLALAERQYVAVAVRT